MAIYKLGYCKICKKLKALKDDVCLECNNNEYNSLSMPDFMKEFFTNPDNNVKN